MCAAAISFARLRRLYYGASDPKGGAVESGVRFFASNTCNHVPEVYSAVGEGEAAALLREFSRRGGDTVAFRMVRKDQTRNLEIPGSLRAPE